MNKISLFFFITKIKETLGIYFPEFTAIFWDGKIGICKLKNDDEYCEQDIILILDKSDLNLYDSVSNITRRVVDDLKLITMSEMLND